MDSKEWKWNHHGSFKVTSGTLLCTDPCYAKGTWCTGTVFNAKIGTWHGYLKTGPTSWGWRCVEVAALYQIHSIDAPSVEVYTEALNNEALWKKFSMLVGVDSGQAGIFEYDAYPIGSTRQADEDFDNPNTFYTRACEATLGKHEPIHIEYPKLPKDTPMEEMFAANDKARNEAHALAAKKQVVGGVMFEGVVASSGFGDGGYSAYALHALDGSVMGVKIIFITEKEEEVNDTDSYSGEEEEYDSGPPEDEDGDSGSG